MAIKVHGPLFSTAVARVLACLHEKDLDYELVPVDMKAGEHKKEPFTSINPFGQVPGFQHDDLKLFESRAINRYIAHTYADKGTPLVCYNDPKKMGIVFVGLEVEAHHYDSVAGKLVRELCLKPFFLGTTGDEAIVEEQEVQLGKILDVYESRLAESKYLCGDTFTLVDLHHLPTLDYLMGTRAKAIFDARPRVSVWCKDIMARPAWQKVIAMRNNH
ncbi:hypothetical protein OROHE_025724 [Orobanche hederae]